MTIRYTCYGCGAVLKIKDEKAGTTGKCPKCKQEFMVPVPEDAGTPGPDEAPDVPAELVDMPVELTPEVADSEEFDPLAVLGGGSAAGRGTGLNSGGAADRKPSLAEMMREFEPARKKERKHSAETSVPSAASAAYAAMETAGTAAEALSKAYQQKRESASAPSRNPKDAKAAEERALLMEFLMKRAIPGLAATVLLIYGYLTWMGRTPYTGPPLFEVSGQVLKDGSPVSGIQISFEPIFTDSQDPRSIVWATSDAEGNFRLMYDAVNFGAPAGDYYIGFVSESGLGIARQAGTLKLTVKENETNNFKIDL